jgi:hypothetical protein
MLCPPEIAPVFYGKEKDIENQINEKSKLLRCLILFYFYSVFLHLSIDSGSADI